jgi:signal transduction histidine kinase/DNA-binding LacI/PurR family transcriptional regulator
MNGDSLKIAVFAPTYSIDLANKFRDGVLYGASVSRKATGKRVIPVFFEGESLVREEGPSRLANRIYNLAIGDGFSGVLVYGGVLGYRVDRRTLEDFCRSFHPLPVVNIGSDLESIPSLTVDNYGGMYRLTEHFITVHGLVKPVYISGPRGHGEAQDRLAGFLAALKEYGVPFDQRSRVLQGDFTADTGKAAADHFINAGLDADAVLAANDEMVYGFVLRAEERECHDLVASLKFGGFDNSNFAHSLDPQLTTMDQPVARLAGQGLDQLLAMIELGPAAGRHRLLVPDLVVRKSCGCSDPLFSGPPSVRMIAGFESAIRTERMNLMEYGSLRHLLFLFQNELGRCLDIGTVWKVLARSMEGLGLTHVSVLRYNGKGQSEYLMTLENGQEESTLPEPIDVRRFPDEVLERIPESSLPVVCPLVPGHEDMGYIILGISPVHSTVAGELAAQLGIILLHLSLEDDRNRTIRELSAARSQIQMAERQAALIKLVSGLSHEMNTPLGTGISAVTYLKDSLDALPADTLPAGFLGKADEILDILIHNLQRAANLMQDFRQLSFHHGETRAENFFVFPVIRNAADCFSHQLLQKKITLTIDCDETLTGFGDSRILYRILLNLIENTLAHAFQDENGGLVEISAGVGDSGELTLRFSDNGAGLADEIRTHLFDPFFTTARNRGFTGLGLHMVYLLVRNYFNGEIECRSAPGDGTEFFIELREPFGAFGPAPVDGSSGIRVLNPGRDDRVKRLIHDMKTPLALCINLGELLTGGRELSTAERAELTLKLMANARRSVDILDSFTRDPGDEKQTGKQVILLKDFFSGLEQSLSLRLEEQSVKLKTEVVGQLKIRENPGVLYRVFQNLVNNSMAHGFIKTSPPHQIAISCRRQGKSVIIDYRDNGSGLEQEMLDRIFEPGLSTGKVEGHSGLGMSIVKRLVTGEMGGSIEITGRSGEGFACRILLPAIVG